MITLLSRLFVKDSKNYASPTVRIAYGVLCGVVGICFNILLFCCKLLAGILSGSIAITADAFNNLSDAGSSIVSLIGFRLSGQQADREHPFGHGRIEYISGLIVSMVIVLMGVELLKSSIAKIIRPVPTQFSWLAAGILAASILVKCYMFIYNRSLGKKIGSATMRAAALDSFSDVAATSVVLLCTFVNKWMGLSIDGYAGTLVALFILYSGFVAAKETVSPLLGEPPTPEYVERIEQLVLSCPDVVGVHDLVVHDYGPGRVMISLHAEVPADGDFIHLHDAIDNIEKQLRGMMGCQAVIHMDPVATDNAEIHRIKAIVTSMIHCIDPQLTMHDFRMVSGPTHTNLVFDVVVPYAVKVQDEEVKRRIGEAIQALDGNYFAVIDVDKSIVR
ncbi:MAG: cation diffusion facilitator family transporter [Clostridia bacterium]